MQPIFYFVHADIGDNKFWQSRETDFFSALQAIQKFRKSGKQAKDIRIIRFDMIPSHLKTLWPRKVTYRV